MLKVKCPSCGKRFKVAEKYAGQEAACTGCGKPIIIPTPQPEPTPQAQAEPAAEPAVDLGDLELDLQSPEGEPATSQDEVGTEADMEVDLPPDEEKGAQPTPSASVTQPAGPASKTFVSIPAIVAIGLGAIALIPVDASAFTYLRMPLSALGLILGLVALVTSLTDRRVVPVLPIAAVLIAGAAVGMAVTGNVRLGLSRFADKEPAAEPAEPEAAPPPAAAAAPAPPPVPVEAPPAAPPPPAVAISVESVRIEAVEFHNEFGNLEKSGRTHLAITVRIVNNGEAAIDYTTWAGIPGSYSLDIAALEDDDGNAYRRVNMGQAAKPVGRVNEATIAPGQTITDLLLFERPIGRIKPLRLELPGANVGRASPYVIDIAPDAVKE